MNRERERERGPEVAEEGRSGGGGRAAVEAVLRWRPCCSGGLAVEAVLLWRSEAQLTEEEAAETARRWTTTNDRRWTTTQSYGQRMTGDDSEMMTDRATGVQLRSEEGPATMAATESWRRRSPGFVG